MEFVPNMKSQFILTALIAFDHFTDCQGAKAVEAAEVA